MAHVRAIFPLHYAGAEIVCYHALNLAPLGHEVTVFATAHGLLHCVEGCP